MQKRVKIIQLPIGNVQKMAKAFNCTQAMIYKALSYGSYSELAENIRKQAIDVYGGVSTTKLILR